MSEQGDEDARGAPGLDGWLREAGQILTERHASRQSELLSEVQRALGIAGATSDGDDDDDDDDDDRPPLTLDERLRRVQVQRLLGVPAERIEVVRIGPYEIRGRIDSGGMGVVYRAFDPRIRREVALKRSHAGERAPGEGWVRAQGELAAMGRVRHPNVVTVFDGGTCEGTPYIVMELVEGKSGEAWRASDPPLAEILRVFKALALGLQAIHDAGLAHVDFKLDNIRFDEAENPRILDFGLATAIGGGIDGGTQEYMACEVLTPQVARAQREAEGGEVRREGLTITAAADQYSFCVALFIVLTGRHPFMTLAEFAETARRSGRESSPRDLKIEYMTRLSASQRQRAIRWPRELRRVPWWIRRVLARGLSPEPAERYPDMRALVAALERWPRRWRQITAYAPVVVGVAALVWGWARVTEEGPCARAAAGFESVWDGVRGRERAGVLAGLFDDYAARWSKVAQTTCELGQVERTISGAVYDAQVACLDGRRRAAAALLEGLGGEVDAGTVASWLRSPEACGAATAVDRPRGAGASAQLEALQGEVLRAEASGRYEEGRAAAERLVALAGERGLEDDAAEGRLAWGRLALMEVANERPEDQALAASGFEAIAQAWRQAGRPAGDASLVAEALIFEVRAAAALWRPRPDEDVARLAAALGGRGVGPALMAQLSDARALGLVVQARGDEARRESLLRAARSLYEEAIGWYRRLGDRYAEAKALENLADRHDLAKQWEEAIAAIDRAAELWRAVAGAASPNFGALYGRRILMRTRLIQWREARELPVTDLEASRARVAEEAMTWLASFRAPDGSRRRREAEIRVAVAQAVWDDLPAALEAVRPVLTARLPARQALSARALAVAAIAAMEEAAGPEPRAEAIRWAEEAEEIFARDYEEGAAAVPQDVEANLQVIRASRRSIEGLTEGVSPPADLVPGAAGPMGAGAGPVQRRAEPRPDEGER